MSEHNKSIVRRLVDEVWKRKNPGLIDEFIDTNSVIHTPDGTLQGPAGYRQLYSTYTKAFPDCEVTIEDMLAEGDKVVTHYTFKGTHRGELMGIASTGRPVSVKGTSIDRLSGGKIVEAKTVWDNLTMMKQLGAFSFPAQAKGKAAR